MSNLNYAIGIGQRVKMKRLELGISQKDLAEAVNIDYSYVSHIESGTRNISIETAIDIAKYLGLSLDYLLTGENIINSSNRASLSDDLLIKVQDILRTPEGDNLRKAIRVLADGYKLLK